MRGGSSAGPGHRKERRRIGHGPVAILVSIAVSSLIVKLIRAGGRSVWTLAGVLAVFLGILIVLSLRGQSSEEQ